MVKSACLQLANRLNDTQALLLHLNDLKDDLFPLARRAAMLFAIIRSLQSVHNEYQFPLHYFIELFDEAVGGELPPEFLNADEEEGVRYQMNPHFYLYINKWQFQFYNEQNSLPCGKKTIVKFSSIWRVLKHV